VARKLRIGLIQMSMEADKQANHAKAERLVRQAAARGADIVCLPELFDTLYFPQAKKDEAAFALAKAIPGPTTRLLAGLAKELGIVLIAPIYERHGKKFYNSIAVIDERGKLLGTYRKMHLPHDPLFWEQHYFEHGDLGFKVFKTRKAKIAPLICFDQWFPEAARIAALKGAEIIFYPTAIGRIKGYKEPDDWLGAWTCIQRAHAIANNVHVAAVNRTGNEGRLSFWGHSFVSDPFGRVLANAGPKKDAALVVEIDLDENQRVREGWGFFRNRRPRDYVELKEPKALKPKKDVLHRKTPAAQGYRFPAEWEKHDALFLAWPYDLITFENLGNVEKAYAHLIRSLQETKSERVNLFVTGKRMRKRVEAFLQEKGADPKKVRFYEHGYADVWFRDYGPSFVANRQQKRLGMVKWRFNAWGGKYQELLKDDSVPARINREWRKPFFRAGMVMEGGAIDVNGRGSLLTTEDCLLNDNRNPGLSRQEIEATLCEYLDVSNVIWLGRGVQGDDTDSHVDNLARFVDEKTIVCAFEGDRRDPNYHNLKDNFERLRKARDADGAPFTVVKLPVPHLVSGGKRMPASYANFYIANKAVLVPRFGLATDARARKIIGRFFPGRKIVGIDCRDLVHGCGTLHCISQQVPKTGFPRGGKRR